MSGLTEGLAEFIHERFAPDYEPHWSDLDETEQRNSQSWDIASAIVKSDFLAAREAALRESIAQDIEVLNRHRPMTYMEARSRLDYMPPSMPCFTCGQAMPCPDARSVLTALNIEEDPR